MERRNKRLLFLHLPALTFVILLNGCASFLSVQKVVIYQDAELIGTNLFQTVKSFNNEALLDESFTNKAMKSFGDRLTKSLKHVQLEKGWCFDYYYATGFIESRPFLYVRRNSEPSYTRDDIIRKKALKTSAARTPPYFRHILLDGTQEGYLELFYLWAMGEQWGLVWHANMSAVDFLFSREAFREAISRVCGKDSTRFNDTEFQIDITPVMVEHNGLITIQVYGNEWEGITRFLWTITKAPPYRIKDIKEERIIENESHGYMTM